MKILLIITSMLFASNVYAGRCVSNGLGDAACGGFGNGVNVIHNNNKPTVNSAVVVQQSNGVNHTITSNGGEAYTKNGKGIVRGAGGTTCVRTARFRGCQ